MTLEQTFEEDQVTERGSGEQLVLDLDGFEGPIDVLLQLARDQKVDVTRISILALADQYLEFIPPGPAGCAWRSPPTTW